MHPRIDSIVYWTNSQLICTEMTDTSSIFTGHLLLAVDLPTMGRQWGLDRGRRCHSRATTTQAEQRYKQETGPLKNVPLPMRTIFVKTARNYQSTASWHLKVTTVSDELRRRGSCGPGGLTDMTAIRQICILLSSSSEPHPKFDARLHFRKYSVPELDPWFFDLSDAMVITRFERCTTRP
ncbi:hypothetical protein K466DRAFT_339854 [Polyporus arcularius HHB13444]|uniref:Uncharacterized protein n=1 Tax=Polyporus arcularius HHB13444 TaxID=1314778 RepID=A0A5C3P6G7_9APHY|nr:hypothetical protein K466DRAFT_339854 [Polyporus arcularius HHB13444]